MKHDIVVEIKGGDGKPPARLRAMALRIQREIDKLVDKHGEARVMDAMTSFYAKKAAERRK